ncbi:MAG: hypothetical protein ABR552_10340 [Actinomycetota bacterium]
MRRVLAFAVCAVALAASTGARAVSSGYYDPGHQGCTGDAENSDHPERVEHGCYMAIVTLSDRTGHQYFGIGVRQIKDEGGEDSGGFNKMSKDLTADVWVDLGAGRQVVTFNRVAGPSTSSDEGNPSMDASSGLELYFGMDDNIDFGEHDSSEQVSNGPSDGGGIRVDVDPVAGAQWIAALQAALATGDLSTVLTHPLPGVGVGSGACADGICFSAGTQKERVWQGYAAFGRDVANYEGKQWDPHDCSGPSDSVARCDDQYVRTHNTFPSGSGCDTGMTLKCWYYLDGTVYAEPGFQFYEDTDPQGSPEALALIGADELVGPEPYPLPALYIGPCGLILGGGAKEWNGGQTNPLWFDDGPQINSAHQLVIETAC